VTARPSITRVVRSSDVPMTDPDGVATGAVVIRLAGSRYALPLAAVVEVGRVPPITRVPGLPGWLVGVTNWRGRLLAVVDLGPLLGGPKTAVAGTTRLLLVSQAAATLGVLADSVDGVGPVTGEPEPAVGTLRADAWVRSPKRSVVSSR
jgi:chemotaxis signal transduction protein